MYDTATAYNRYKYLGNEFLTWVWYIIESKTDIKSLANFDCARLQVEIGNGIVLENVLDTRVKEKITIKGDEVGLEEGKTALKKGAFVTDINLFLKIDETELHFTLKGESMNITSFKTVSAKIEKSEDIETRIMEKALLIEKTFLFVDMLFNVFIAVRSSDTWVNKYKNSILNWIHN